MSLPQISNYSLYGNISSNRELLCVTCVLCKRHALSYIYFSSVDWHAIHASWIG